MSVPIFVSKHLSSSVTDQYKEDGIAWLERLPELLEACARRWDLRIDDPMTEDYTEMSFNYIAPATRRDGTEVIVKVGSHKPDVEREREILQTFGGEACVELLDHDGALNAMLLERLRPGVPVGVEPNDDENTRILARIMRQLWREPPPEHSLRPMEVEFSGLERLRARFNGGTGPLPETWVEKAEAEFTELIATSPKPVVLHGDLHHWNVLSAERAPWLAIDPKGIVGDPCYEFHALFGNYPENSCKGKDWRELLARRIEILVEETGMSRHRILTWGWASAVLHASWSAEVGGDWQESIERAETLEGLI